MNDISSQFPDYNILKQVYAHSESCIKVLDLSGKILSFNRYGLELLEIENEQDVLGSKWIDFWADEVKEMALQCIKLAKKGQTSSFEGFCPTFKDTPKWWDVVLVPIIDEKKKVIQILAVSRDITERKKIEQELISLNSELMAKQAELQRAESLLERMLKYTERNT